MLPATSIWVSLSEKHSLPASPGVRSQWWGWARRALGIPTCLGIWLSTNTAAPGHISQPLLGSHSMELLLALCRAYFLVGETLSAGGAFLSMKGLAWSRQRTTAVSSTAAIGAGIRCATGLSLPLVHSGTGCLVWTDCFSWSIVWDRRLSTVVSVPGTVLGSGPAALTPWTPLAGLGWGPRLNQLDF